MSFRSTPKKCGVEKRSLKKLPPVGKGRWIIGESTFEAAKYSSLLPGRQCFPVNLMHAGSVISEERTQTGIADHDAITDHDAIANHNSVADQNSVADEYSVT